MLETCMTLAWLGLLALAARCVLGLVCAALANCFRI